jgi:hypothetical protein
MDYFTKWIEAVSLKNIRHKEMIEFITEHIIHRSDIPQTLTMGQGISFVSKEVWDFVELYKIKLFNSSPYYVQANGQAESSNKTLTKLNGHLAYLGMRFYLKLCGHLTYLAIGYLHLGVPIIND